MTELERSARNAASDEPMTFDQWLDHGMNQGWCGPAVCETHDGLPASDSEVSQFEEGFDPCLHVLRLYPDEHTRKQVERDHPPSVWRRTNREHHRSL